MGLLDAVKKLSGELAPKVVGWRRYLHANPELSFQEYNTASWVAGELRKYAISSTPISTTGLVVLIAGKNPSSKVIALRADMDALPITEQNDVPYKSCNPGVMHACGHDAHTASLMGVAVILHSLRDQFDGTVKLLFQPGEEKNPGGASYLIRDGALVNPVPEAIIGQHVMPLLPVGKVGFREGMYMASSDEIYLRVLGKGGHASAPDLVVDPVLIAAHLVVALQQIVSRNASPKQPTVLSFGKIQGNGATNIVPDEVTLAGTFRALNENWRQEGLTRIQHLAEGLAASMGGRCEVTISHGYPYLENNPALTQRIRRAAEAYLGKENVVDIELTLGSEDFAYYSQVLPASFYRLGTRNEARGITSYIHTPTFDIDEAALEIGPGLMAWMSLQELGAQP